MPHRLKLSGLALLSILTTASPLLARSSGAPYFGCTGCHNGGGTVTDISLEPSGELAPGQTTEFTLTIRYDSMAKAGFFLSTDGTGTLEPIAGGGAATTISKDLTHDGPLPVTNGEAQARFSWTAPEDPGGVTFKVYVLAADGNGNSRGDSAGDDTFSFIWGCDEGIQLYRDFDGDGFGSDAYMTMLGCEDSPGWATQAGDCDDNRAEVYPGATEVCNERDDDCDDLIDEDTEPRPLYPDADGDGHGIPGGESIMGCADGDGYAALADDCDDTDPDVYLDAEEVCDLKDNNCDGRVDEGVRPRCGVGWCERLASTCDESTCTPGLPSPETCNFLDDDCDGVVDNNAACDAGQTCYQGQCVNAEDVESLAQMPSNGESMLGSGGGAGQQSVAVEPLEMSMAGAPPGTSAAGTNTTGSSNAPSVASSDSAANLMAETNPGSGSVSQDSASMLNTPNTHDEAGGCAVATGTSPTRSGVSWLLWMLGVGLSVGWRRARHAE